MTSLNDRNEEGRAKSVRRVDFSPEAIRVCRGPVTVYVTGDATLEDAEMAAAVLHDACLYGGLCPQIAVGLFAKNRTWHIDYATCTFKPDALEAATSYRYQSEAQRTVKAALAAAGFSFATRI